MTKIIYNSLFILCFTILVGPAVANEFSLFELTTRDGSLENFPTNSIDIFFFNQIQSTTSAPYVYVSSERFFPIAIGIDEEFGLLLKEQSIYLIMFHMIERNFEPQAHKDSVLSSLFLSGKTKCPSTTSVSMKVPGLEKVLILTRLDDKSILIGGTDKEGIFRQSVWEIQKWKDALEPIKGASPQKLNSIKIPGFKSFPGFLVENHSSDTDAEIMLTELEDKIMLVEKNGEHFQAYSLSNFRLCHEFDEIIRASLIEKNNKKELWIIDKNNKSTKWELVNSN